MGQIKILKASAGSGKTYRLAYEYLRGVVEHPERYRSTLAVTFTNKATEEMKRRIVAGLDQLARGRGAYLAELVADTGLPAERIVQNARVAMALILHDYSRFSVSTIDKFFQRVSRAFFKEMGLDLDYTVEIDQKIILAEAVASLLDHTATDPVLRGWIEQLMEGYAEQGKSNRRLEGELLRMGETLFRESYQPNALPPEELSARFEAIGAELQKQWIPIQADAEEALRIIEQAGLQPDDFFQGKRGFAAALTRWASYKRLPLNGELSISSFYAAAMEDSEGWFAKKSPHRPLLSGLADTLMPLVQSVGRQVERLQEAHTSYLLIRENLGKSLLLGKLDAEVEAVCARRNVVLLQRTVDLVHRLVSGNDAPFIYEKVGGTYDRYLIDEFQDTSQKQWENFQPLLENALAATEGDAALLIGDVKQSIYRWRGGSWRVLGSEAEERFAGQLAPTAPMTTNWRSERNIIDFNNHLIGHAVEQDQRQIASLLPASAEWDELRGLLEHSYRDSRQQANPAREQAAPEGYAEITPCLRSEQYTLLAQRVEELTTRGYPLRQIAVLTRTRKQAEEAAHALLQAGFAIISPEALLLASSPVVGFVVALFRLALDPAHPVARAQYNAFLGRSYTDAIDPAGGALLEELPRRPSVEAFERVVAHFALGERPNDVAFLQAFGQEVFALHREGYSDLRAVLNWWEEQQGKKTLYLPSEQDAVTILTIHKAKGLEFPCVLIPSCDWSLLPRPGGLLWCRSDRAPFDRLDRLPVPYKKATLGSCFSGDYLRESVYSHIDNINLLYVALTRAGRELYLFYDSAGVQAGSVNSLVDSFCDWSELRREGDSFCFGEKGYITQPAAAAPESLRFLERLPSREAAQNIRISLASDRYFGNDHDDVSPRRYGITMHRLFSRIETVDDLPGALERMILGGEIAPADRDRIETLAAEALRQPVVAQWFDPEAGWRIRSEQEILVREGNRRPDRVMTRGDQARVVDYKFGALQRPEYRRQVENYLQLLQQMGYSDVLGYLWYVEQGAIEEVTTPTPA